MNAFLRVNRTKIIYMFLGFAMGLCATMIAGCCASPYWKGCGMEPDGFVTELHPEIPCGADGCGKTVEWEVMVRRGNVLEVKRFAAKER